MVGDTIYIKIPVGKYKFRHFFPFNLSELLQKLPKRIRNLLFLDDFLAELKMFYRAKCPHAVNIKSCASCENRISVTKMNRNSLVLKPEYILHNSIIGALFRAQIQNINTSKSIAAMNKVLGETPVWQGIDNNRAKIDSYELLHKPTRHIYL